MPRRETKRGILFLLTTSAAQMSVSSQDCDVAVLGGEIPSLFASAWIGKSSSVCLVLPPSFSSMSHSDPSLIFLPRRRISAADLPLLSDVRSDIVYADSLFDSLSSILPLSPVEAPLSLLSQPATCSDLDLVSCTNETTIPFASSSYHCTSLKRMRLRSDCDSSTPDAPLFSPPFWPVVEEGERNGLLEASVYAFQRETSGWCDSRLSSLEVATSLKSAFPPSVRLFYGTVYEVGGTYPTFALRGRREDGDSFSFVASSVVVGETERRIDSSLYPSLSPFAPPGISPSQIASTYERQVSFYAPIGSSSLSFSSPTIESVDLALVLPSGRILDTSSYPASTLLVREGGIASIPCDETIHSLASCLASLSSPLTDLVFLYRKAGGRTTEESLLDFGYTKSDLASALSSSSSSSKCSGREGRVAHEYSSHCFAPRIDACEERVGPDETETEAVRVEVGIASLSRGETASSDGVVVSLLDVPLDSSLHPMTRGRVGERLRRAFVVSESLSGEGGVCQDTCGGSNYNGVHDVSSDGECDDGGAGSHYSICPFGTDCSDCGTRPPRQ